MKSGIAILIIVGLGIGGLQYYKYSQAAAADIKTTGVGVIGDELLIDGLVLSVNDAESVPINKNGVNVLLVSALIGNGGRKGMNAPTVDPVLIDSFGREASPNKKEGMYTPGIPINPEIFYTQFWAFTVAENVQYTRFEVTLENGKKFVVDLTKRTPANQAMRDEAERQKLQKGKQDFIEKLGGNTPALPDQGPARPPAQPLANLLAQDVETRTALADKIKCGVPHMTQATMNAQKAEKRAKSMENMSRAAQATLERCQKALGVTVDNLEKIRQSYNAANAHDRLRLQNDEARAVSAVELAQSHVDDAKADLIERQKKATDADLEAKSANVELNKISAELQQLNAQLAQLNDKIGSADEKIEVDPTDAPASAPAPAPTHRPTALEIEQMNAARDAERSRHKMNWNDN